MDPVGYWRGSSKSEARLPSSSRSSREAGRQQPLAHVQRDTVRTAVGKVVCRTVKTQLLGLRRLLSGHDD
jgi:hypothetical protein